MYHPQRTSKIRGTSVPRRRYSAHSADALAVEEALTHAEPMAAAGLRVLAIGIRRWARRPTTGAHVEQNLTLLGFVGLLDPPRSRRPASGWRWERAGRKGARKRAVEGPGNLRPR